jgi:hypothetical protein
MTGQKQRRNAPVGAPSEQKVATGNPDAAQAAAKARDALTKIVEQHPLANISPDYSDPPRWERSTLWERGVDVDALVERRKMGGAGLCCYCGDWNCNIGEFLWREKS